MRHLLIIAHALLERLPSALEGMCTPQVPIVIDKQFPVNLRVIVDI